MIKIGFMAALGVVLCTGVVQAEVVAADPSNYRSLLDTLAPGDTLQLAPGRYPRLTLRDLHGTSEAWITISGPETGDPAIIESESCCNTVQLYNSSFLAVQDLTIDVGGLDVDAVNAKDSISHNIRIENNVMMNFPEDQLIVGINTKSTAWNWVIRGNHIIGAGTGIYFGGSSGDSPFINGIIENNLIINPIGYCLQVKQQNEYTLIEGMPVGPSRTIIRNNVLIKNDRPGTAGSRPNLLVSGFPRSGPGSMDHYEIYGNFIFYNPRESLFQGAGRVRMHDNVFVGNGSQTAILMTPHQGKDIQVAHIYNNTIYGVARGIQMTAAATVSSRVVGNLIFADDPIGGMIEDLRDNVVDDLVNAAMYVNSPSTMLDEMDFFPKTGMAQGSALDLSAFSEDVDYTRDFNGADKGDPVFRGAYAGEGANPGWTLAADFKRNTPGSPDGGSPGGGSPGGGSPGGGSPDGGSGGGGSGGPDAGSEEASSGGGCSAASTRHDTSSGRFILLLLLAGFVLHRRSRRQLAPRQENE